jgi:hypothetical protein
MAPARVDHALSLAPEGGPVRAYGEGAFRFLLAVERKRAERSGRPLLVVIVRNRDPRARGSISPSLAHKVFAALALCTRETDFIGWYRDGQTAAAVLTQRADQSPDVLQRIRDRVADAVRDTIPGHAARRIHFRLWRLSCARTDGAVSRRTFDQ